MSTFALTRNLWLFAALSLSDLGLTGYLLSRNGGAYESNPAAAWWLEHFGWGGLVGFKLATLGLTIAVVLVVWRRKPNAASQVLRFGCATLVAVIVYSSSLVPSVQAEDDFAGRIEARHQELNQQLTHYSVYATELSRLTNELMAGECSLTEAVEILASFEQVNEPSWSEAMAERFPSYTMRELLAIRLMLEVIEFPGIDTDRSERLAYALGTQFEDCFGRPAPLPALTPKSSQEDRPMQVVPFGKGKKKDSVNYS